MRKIRLLVFLTLFIPATLHAVLLPIGWGLAIATGYFSGASTIILPLVAASLAVGAAISWVTIGGVPGSTAETAPLMVQIDPKAPLATPPGWTDPVAPAIQPVPPSTVAGGSPGSTARSLSTSCSGFNTGVTELSNGDAKFCGDGTSATGYMCTTNPPPSGWNLVELMAGTNTCTTSGGTWRASRSVNCSGGYWDLATNSCTSASCPTGYTFNSGSGQCDLTNANVVQKPSDGRCFIIRTGNSYGADGLDPDCAAGLPAQWSAGPNSISWGGLGNGDGGGAVVIDPATGEVSITSHKQNSDATTTTTTIKGAAPVSGAAPGAGVTVKGISETTKLGVGSEAGTVPNPDFPTDYNRETTQQSILGKLGSGVKVDEAGTPTDGSLSGKLSDFDAAASGRVTSLQGVGNVTDLGLGLSITWPVSSCIDPEFVIPHTGQSITIPMCSRRSDIQAVLNYLTAILAAITIFSIGAGALVKQG